MIKKNLKNKNGFIAIVSLLIVTTVSMSFALRILFDGINNSSLSLNSIYYEDARINAITCYEDALVRIKREEVFDENVLYLISEDNSCSTSLSWDDPVQTAPSVLSRNLTLDSTGISNNFTRHFQYKLRIDRHDVNNTDGTLNYYNVIEIISEEEVFS